MASTENDASVEEVTNEEMPASEVAMAESNIMDLGSMPPGNDDDLSGVQGDEDEEGEEGFAELSVQVDKERSMELSALPSPPKVQEPVEKQTNEEGGRIAGVDDTCTSVVEGLEGSVEQSGESSVSGQNTVGDESSANVADEKDSKVTTADAMGEIVEPAEESNIIEPIVGDVSDSSNAEVEETDAGVTHEEVVQEEEKEDSQGDNQGQAKSFEDEGEKESDPLPMETVRESDPHMETVNESGPPMETVEESDPATVETVKESDPPMETVRESDPPMETVKESDPATVETVKESDPARVETVKESDPPPMETVRESDPHMETVKESVPPPVETVKESDAPHPMETVRESDPPMETVKESDPAPMEKGKESAPPPPMETVKESDSPPEVTEEAGHSNLSAEGKSEEVSTDSDLLKDTPREGEDVEQQVGDIDDDALLEMEDDEENEEMKTTDEASNSAKEEGKEDKFKSDDLDGEGMMEKWNLEGEIEGDGDDGFQEAAGDEEPMETDEFDELENAIKRQSEEKKTQEVADEGNKPKEDSSQDDDNVLESEPMEDDDKKDEPTKTQSVSVSEDDKESQDQEQREKADSKEEKSETDEAESEKKQVAGDGDGDGDSKDQLSDSQEMWMQYDGEDLLETMVSDEDSEKQNQTDETDAGKSDKPAAGLEETMEVDTDATAKETEKSEEAEKNDSEGKKPDSEGKKPEDKEPEQTVDETDVIDMIEERTISPLLQEKLNTPKTAIAKISEVKSEEKSQEKPSSDVVVIEDESTKDNAKPPDGDTSKEGTEEGDKSKDSSLSTSDDKRRKSGGISISSIVSRLTQNLSEKMKPEKEDAKPATDKSMPVITQVKTLAQDPPKEKVGRKSVYKKEDVVNRCSHCFNTFLSLNPIKHNNAKFCSTECLQKKTGMSADSLVCTNCKTAFPPNSTSSCTLKVGMSQTVKSFCSQTCKSDFQKRAKPCSNCGEDISGTNNAFMAQIGEEGKFMEFCSQSCVETYEKKFKDQPPPQKKESSSERKACSMCKKMTTIKHEVKFRGSYYHMCGPDCFANFRRRNNLSLRTCNQCGTTCYNEHSPGEEKDGHKVFFCSQKCLEVFQHSRSLSEPCFSCKTMYKQGMLIEGKASNGKVYKFCSQDCLKKGLPTSGETVNNSSSRMKTTNVVSVQGPRMATQVQVANVKPVVKPNGVKPSSTDPAAASQNQGLIPCNHCKKVQRPLYHLTMSDSSLRNFCSYPCVIAFQAQFNVPPVTLPQETLLLRCGQCQRGFSHRPKTLDYQGETRLFCATNCLEDFKRTQSVIAICDCCFEEKILFEETNFLGKARYFCSPGCSLIFKNQFVKRIGLRCAMCDYCSTMCKVATVSVLGGIKKRFCGDECKESYHQWYNRMARCEGCKRMGCELTESFRWRGKVKRVCNEQCLLLFYTQQNVPDMGTQLQSELNSTDKPVENGSSGIPTITNVKSLAGPTSNSDATVEPKTPMAHKQTQITTNTIFVKPPPPPPTPPPPAPKQVKNKITLCKPYAVSKSITCKPISKDAESQSDFEPVFVPVPVPIYIPVPMQMYTTPVPQPMPIPIPIPTPMFIPVAYSDCDRLMESIEEVKNTIPSDPLEADILMMATAIAGKEESTRKPPPPVETRSTPEDISDLLPLEEEEVPDLPNKFLEGDSDIAGMLAEGLETLDSSDLFPDERVTRSSTRTTRSATQGVEDSEPSTSRRARTRGAKRVCVEAVDDTESSQSPESVKDDVRPDIGPAAYSFYLQQMEKVEPVDEKLKPNLTVASVDELHYCLCRFVKEARQPDGEMYSADTLYLILLSIQKYLTTNKRKENIFVDPYFVTFSNLLHERLAEHPIITDPMADMSIGSTCLDEEFLWESKQLGAHSPSVLLSTILYFCTKEFMLKTVAMHKDLAFCRVQRLVRKDIKGRRIPYVRFIPSPENSDKDASGKGRKRPLDIDYSLEFTLNTKQPLRCPVKLHEFYLSKCPESVKASSKSFYVVPERACVPDSPLWYSDKPMSDKMIERYLYRHLMVKDVHEHWEMLRLKKEEGSDDSDEE